MKTIALFFFAMFITFGLCACDQDNHHDQKISIEVLKAFEQKFPDAVGVEWEKEGRYYVADFRSTLPEGQTGVKYELEAWFDSSANWRMTVKDVTYDMLPQVVKDGFTASNFGAWNVEDSDIVERNGKDTVYVLEVEQGHQERYLYFNSNGKLTQERKNGSDDYRDLL